MGLSSDYSKAIKMELVLMTALAMTKEIPP